MEAGHNSSAGSGVISTRLTNAFSKKLENLKAALSLHFAWYNFCRIHSFLRVTPAMAAGLQRSLES